jgi:hypothetical protein
MGMNFKLGGVIDRIVCELRTSSLVGWLLPLELYHKPIIIIIIILDIFT